MMKHSKKAAVVTAEKGAVLGKIENTLMGAFLEHMGRAVYTGIYEPGHPHSDEEGFRLDVLAAVKELGVPLVRYPGGNFVSGYRWQDGIGDKALRPRRLERAWHAVETNQVGIDEFAKWAERAGCAVMPAVNMGTAGPQDAADLVEYCNFSGGTLWSDARRQNGREAPYRFQYWCIGNEMDGPWQIGHLSAAEYGRKANEAIKLMKLTDPDIKVTVVGSSNPDLPTYPEWDRVVLEHTYENTDYLSLHRYYGYNPKQDSETDFLYAYLDLDKVIRTIKAAADYVKAYRRSKKTMLLSLDEWNVWHAHLDQREGLGWDSAAPILENQYTVRDALLFSGMMMTLINNADRVKIGCMAQLINVIAPIMTRPGGGLLKQTIFYPYLAGCRYAKGETLCARVSCEKVETVYGDADLLYCAVTYDRETGELAVFLLNSSEEPLQTRLDLKGFGGLAQIEHLVFTGEPDAVNTFEHPSEAVMQRAEGERPFQPGETVQIMAHSFHVFRYREIH